MNALLTEIRDRLSGIYDVREATAIARMVLTELLAFTPAELYGVDERRLTASERQQLSAIVRRLQQHEPIQYIIGEEVFDGLRFKVSPAVLIPRPETAELVEWILADGPFPASTRFLDIGTGSGCIAITLKKRMPHIDMTAWDISAEALAVARDNAGRHHAGIHLKQVDVFNQTHAEADVIVSNPPYIAERERQGMAPNVCRWEPPAALFVPDDDALCFYRHIAGLGAPILYLEINQAYGEETTRLLRQAGYTRVTLRKDLYGNNRMIKATYR